jgi:hypothetical protein
MALLIYGAAIKHKIKRAGCCWRCV